MKTGNVPPPEKRPPRNERLSTGGKGNQTLDWVKNKKKGKTRSCTHQKDLGMKIEKNSRALRGFLSTGENIEKQQGGRKMIGKKKRRKRKGNNYLSGV